MNNSYPIDWSIIKLGNNRYLSLIPSGIDIYLGTKDYLSTSSIQEDKIIKVEEKITHKDRPSRANMQPELDSVWFAKMKNTLKVYLFNDDNEEEINQYILSTGFSGIKCKKEVNSHFLKQILLSDFFNRMKNKLAEGSTQKAISNDDIRLIEIGLPSLDEQRGISEVLGTVDKCILLIDIISGKAEELKKGLMQRFFTQGIGHIEQKQTYLGRVPKEWKLQSLQKLGKIITGTTPSTKRTEYYGNDFPFVSPKDIGETKFIKNTEKKLSEMGLKSGNEIPQNSILVVCISSIDGIGKIGITTERCATNQQINSVICEHVDPDFLYYSLQYYRKRVQLFATRTSGHFAIINKSTFSQFKIPIPTIKEQIHISSTLSKIDEYIEINNTLKEKYSILKNGLVQELLMGKIRVELKGDELHRIGDSREANN